MVARRASRRKAAQGPAGDQAGDRRARQRLARHRRTWPVDREGRLVPGPEHRLDADATTPASTASRCARSSRRTRGRSAASCSTAMRGVLEDTADRYAYYPGARARWDAFRRPTPRRSGSATRRTGCVPWTMIPGLRPDTEQRDRVHHRGVQRRVRRGRDRRDRHRRLHPQGGGVRQRRAVGHPRLLDHRPPEVDEGPGGAARGRAGDRRPQVTARSASTIWSAVGFLLGTTPWGAYPGHTIDDVQSGIGFVHNSIMLAEADIEKTVVRGPFRMPIKPTWFASQQDRAQGRRACCQADGEAVMGQGARRSSPPRSRG